MSVFRFSLLSMKYTVSMTYRNVTLAWTKRKEKKRKQPSVQYNQEEISEIYYETVRAWSLKECLRIVNRENVPYIPHLSGLYGSDPVHSQYSRSLITCLPFQWYESSCYSHTDKLLLRVGLGLCGKTSRGYYLLVLNLDCDQCEITDQYQEKLHNPSLIFQPLARFI